MRVLDYDPAPSLEAERLGIEFVSLDRLLAESDFVSLHSALTPETRGLIGEAQLRAMKSSAILINTARGAVVDEAALARALREGWIAGAALDVFVVEPLPADHPLHAVPNLLLTPHQASLGYGSFITTTINFLIIAWILFLVVRGLNRLFREEQAAPPPPAPPTKEQELLTEIRDLLKARA